MRRAFVVAAFAVCGISLLVPAASSADTQVFLLRNNEQAFTVPTGVTAIQVVAVGAPGGRGATIGAGIGGDDGLGGHVSAQVAVTPGQVLYVEVGGFGTDGTWSSTPPQAGAGGFNGGGTGGLGDCASGTGCGGGGGGGASDIRLCSIHSMACAMAANSLDSRILVAAGGGGGGSGNVLPANGGRGGDSSASGSQGGNSGGGGGDAGNQTNGGAGGSDGGGGVGAAGSKGQGGNGPSQVFPGGGGGGGYYGGGSGGGGNGTAGGGGGGGSNFVDLTQVTNVAITTASSGTPSVAISYSTGASPPTGVSPPTGASPPTGRRAVALKRCKSRAHKHDWSNGRLKKCKRKAQLLPV